MGGPLGTWFAVLAHLVFSVMQSWYQRALFCSLPQPGNPGWGMNGAGLACGSPRMLSDVGGCGWV